MFVVCCGPTVRVHRARPRGWDRRHPSYVLPGR
jgi:hypothetical protein